MAQQGVGMERGNGKGFKSNTNVRFSHGEKMTTMLEWGILIS